jgi:hypothetical protein
MKDDNEKYNQFTEDNIEVILPVNMEVDNEITSDSIKEVEVHVEDLTPKDSLKESNTSLLWTEVVRRDKNKNKTKSRNDKIKSNDRCCLEY